MSLPQIDRLELGCKQLRFILIRNQRENLATFQRQRKPVTDVQEMSVRRFPALNAGYFNSCDTDSLDGLLDADAKKLAP